MQPPHGITQPVVKTATGLHTGSQCHDLLLYVGRWEAHPGHILAEADPYRQGLRPPPSSSGEKRSAGS
jgi:hypothetical protein